MCWIFIEMFGGGSVECVGVLIAGWGEHPLEWLA